MTRLRKFVLLSLLLPACAALLHGQSRVDTLNLTFTSIDVPGAVVTNVLGINTAGDVVGTYITSTNGPGHGFLYSGGNFTLFDYPGASSTLAFGINDSGLISGTAYINNGTAAVSFLYDGTTFTTLRAPGDSATLAHGINNSGVVVGGDGLSISGTKGFALVGGRFMTVSPPGVYVYVFGNGINNLNQIVGTDDSGAFFYNKGQIPNRQLPGCESVASLGHQRQWDYCRLVCIVQSELRARLRTRERQVYVVRLPRGDGYVRRWYKYFRSDSRFLHS